jgi:hypothetical protein
VGCFGQQAIGRQILNAQQFKLRAGAAADLCDDIGQRAGRALMFEQQVQAAAGLQFDEQAWLYHPCCRSGGGAGAGGLGRGRVAAQIQAVTQQCEIQCGQR